MISALASSWTGGQRNDTGRLTEQATDWADVKSVDRPTTHIIEKRGTELEGAIKSTRLVESVGALR